MTWEVPGLHTVHEHGFPRYDNTAVERLLKMQPTVDCSGSNMRLQVQNADSKPGSLLFVDRGDLSPLSLSKLPKSCGYKVSSTRRDLVMVAPYDGCFVIFEESRYVLPLRWLGLPVQMSCPMSQPSLTSSSNPPMVTCHSEGMVVKTDWTSGLSEIKVNLNGNWEPLMKASPRCGLGAVEHPEGITISISYKPCMGKKDEMYSIGLLRDDEVKVFCPSLTSADSSKVMMDVGLPSILAPTQNVRTSPQVPEYPLPPSPSLTWNQFYPVHWNTPQPEAVQPAVPQPADDKVVGQPFYPVYPGQHLPEKQNPGSVPPDLDENLGHYYYPMFYPNMPPIPEQPPQPENPSVDVIQLYYPEWYVPEPHLTYPFYYPQDPVKSTAAPEPAAPPDTEVPPVYLYPFYYPTEQSPITTTAASPPATIQQYQLFGPYNYPLPSQHPPHTTTTPTPAAQKPQDPPISRPGTVVIYPQNAKPETRLPVDCPQYCQLGLPNCCPQIAFHHHTYHFVPQEQNGNSNPQFLYPIQFLNGLRPNFVYASSQSPQEAPAPPSRTAFTNALLSPQLYPLQGLYERHIYNQPLEGNPSAESENKPHEQTDLQPATHHFDPNAYLPYRNHASLWNHQNHNPEPQNGAPLHYSEYFDPEPPTNMYLPYNVQSSQSDGPNVNPATLLSRIHQYVIQPVNNANADVKGPASLVFHSQQEPPLVPYHALQEQDNLAKPQPAEALRTAKRRETESFFSQPKGYVLLQQGPPGRESGNTVLSGQNLNGNFPNQFLNLKEEFKDSKRLESENSGNADLTPGDMPQMSSSAGPNSPLSQDPSVRGKPTVDKPVRFSQRPFSPFGYRHRTSQHNAS
ncbi:hypothetical protein NL108_016941 [Boleophthalmus pectinirostris]|nr:hypothetical protein NL108_016941 [Boleophthalmus pectinirostris]